MTTSNEQPAGEETAVPVPEKAAPPAPLSGFDSVDDSSIPDTIDVPADPAAEAPALDPKDIPDTQGLINYGPNPNVTLNVGSPLREPMKGKFEPEKGYIDIPTMSLPEFRRVTGSYANYKLGAGEEVRRWQDSASASRALYLKGDPFSSALVDPESQWQQSLTVGTEELRADIPKFIEPTGKRVSGEDARTRIRSILNSGTRLRIPLWHTGIWITVTAPPESALLELDQRIANMKTELGRMTYGFVFSQTSVYLAGAMVDFILEHTNETSYQGEISELRSLILQPDYMQMIWGMLGAIYPDGYVYQQPCMVNPFKCGHVETARLHFGKMSLVNNHPFTDFQRQHMRKRKPGTQSPADVQRYQSEHKFMRNAVVQLHPRLALELKVPTLAEYEQAGQDWVDSSIEAVENVFGKDMDENERNQQIKRHANMSTLQQYSHWIRMVTIQPDGIHVEEPKSIQEVLSDLANDDDVFVNFFNGIQKYMDGIMLVVHGVPTTQCPECQEAPTPEQLKHPMVFPIDLSETFFTLVVQRIRRMLARQRD